MLREQRKLNVLFILQDQEESFFVCIIMEATVYLFANATKIYQFEAKVSEIKPYYCVYKIFQKILQSIK